MHAFVKPDVRLTVIPPCAEYYEYSIIVIRFTIYSQYDLLVRYPIDRKKSFECCKRNEANKIFRSCMETKKRSRERLPFSEDLWRLLCVLIFIFLLFFLSLPRDRHDSLHIRSIRRNRIRNCFYPVFSG